jgi:transposase
VFLKQTRQKNGRINISIVEGYRDPVTKKVKHRLIENLGYVDEYLDRYEDPIAHFKEVVRQKNLELEQQKTRREIHLGKVYADELMELNEDAIKHLGFIPLSSIYHELKLDQFLNNRQRNRAMGYSFNDVMQLLVYTRILSPGSKRHSFLQKKRLAGTYNCEWYDVYRALDYFAEFRDDLLLHLHEQVRINYKRRTNVVFYDVTNYHFEIDQEDDFRRKGFCKQNTHKPLVQMGLLLDEDSIPIAYRLFKGNTHDSQTMMPLLQEVRKTYELGRIITVADKALNSGDNVAFLMAKNDGFIFSQKIRGADSELQKFVLDQKGYVEAHNVIKETYVADENNEKKPACFIKSRPYPQEFWITHADDKKRKIPLDVKQIVCYNELYARRQKHNRAKLIAKAKKIIDHPHRYNKNDTCGALRYINNIEYDPESGECLNSKRTPYLNLEQIAEDEKFDGYYALITSEIDMPDIEVVKTYHSLWEIEHSFRITKHDLKTRPVHVSLEARIQAHFLTCFIALLILRLLNKRLEEKYSPEQILQSLRQYQACYIKDNVFRSTYYDQVIEDIADALNLSLNQRFLTIGDMRQLIADSKKEF